MSRLVLSDKLMQQPFLLGMFVELDKQAFARAQQAAYSAEIDAVIDSGDMESSAAAAAADSKDSPADAILNVSYIDEEVSFSRSDQLPSRMFSAKSSEPSSVITSKMIAAVKPLRTKLLDMVGTTIKLGQALLKLKEHHAAGTFPPSFALKAICKVSDPSAATLLSNAQVEYKKAMLKALAMEKKAQYLQSAELLQPPSVLSAVRKAASTIATAFTSVGLNIESLTTDYAKRAASEIMEDLVMKRAELFTETSEREHKAQQRRRTLEAADARVQLATPDEQLKTVAKKYAREAAREVVREYLQSQPSGQKRKPKADNKGKGNNNNKKELSGKTNSTHARPKPKAKPKANHNTRLPSRGPTRRRLSNKSKDNSSSLNWRSRSRSNGSKN